MDQIENWELEIMSIEIKLNKDLDLDKYANIYRKEKQLHIPDLLEPECAQQIFQALCNDVPWQTNFNDGEKGHTLHKLQVDAIKETQRDLLLTHITQKAQYDFQYVFNAYSLSDARETGLNQELSINGILDFMNSESYLEFLKYITGHDTATFCDAQCTLYRPGHFLSDHSDNVEGKNRLAATVISFTPNWRPDWGGILQFIDEDGHISRGITPTFNSLNIFDVPQSHSVSYVVPHAPDGRYAVTGWLRSGAPPKL